MKKKTTKTFDTVLTMKQLNTLKGGTDKKKADSEVAVEEIEIAVESFQMEIL